VRRVVLVVAALVAFAAAGALGLLASDVRHWETQLARDDLAFRSAATAPALFSSRERLPGGAARALLAIEDDLTFRRTLQLLRRSIEGDPNDPEPQALRSAAEIALADLARSDPDPRRRSQATNLLGVLAVAGDGQQPGRVRGNRLESAIASFRSAVLLDDRNDRAKYNLELALRSRDPGQDEDLPRSVGGKGSLGRAGSGY
jgi:hypothetical protein